MKGSWDRRTDAQPIGGSRKEFESGEITSLRSWGRQASSRARARKYAMMWAVQHATTVRQAALHRCGCRCLHPALQIDAPWAQPGALHTGRRVG